MWWWWVMVGVATTLALLACLRRLGRARTVRLYHGDHPTVQTLVAGCSALFDHRPTPWLALDPTGHLHTVVGGLLRKRLTPRAEFLRRQVVLADGGLVALDFFQTPNAHPLPHHPAFFATSSSGTDRRREGGPGDDEQPLVGMTRPIVVLQHGLCGSSQSFYVRHCARYLLDRHPDWIVACMVARGCGYDDETLPAHDAPRASHVPLSTPESFTAARTDDFRQCLALLAEACPDAPILAMGWSLGAGLLGKFLGTHAKPAQGEAPAGASPGPDSDADADPDQPQRMPANVCGAVMVNPAWDFHQQTWAFPLWSRAFLGAALKRYTDVNFDALAANAHGINCHALAEAATAREFDQMWIVPRHGYSCVEEYYTDASCGRVSHSIVCPTLAINAIDDPVCTHKATPVSKQQLGQGLVVCVSGSGGHCVGAEGWLPHQRAAWYDRVALQWMEGCLAHWQETHAC